MLRKVIAIRNVGRFRNSVATPNPSLGKHTVVFGANGYGKTTFSTILRSLQSGDGALILGRSTLGMTDSPSVELLFDNQSYRFSNGTWSAALSGISIFDGLFVSQNIHAGEVVDSDQRRNLYRIIIGSEGVKLATEERLIVEKSRQLQSDLTAIEKTLKGFSLRIDITKFIALPDDPDIDTKLDAQKQLIAALKETVRIISRPPLVQIPSPQAFDIDSLIHETIAGLAANAEGRLAQHMARHAMDDGGQRWIAEGMQYVGDDECPFCGRGDLRSLPLFRAYEALFSDAYTALQSKISVGRSEIDENYGDSFRATCRTVVAENEAASLFWAQYCQINPRFPDLTIALEKIGSAHSILKSLIERKERALLEVIKAPREISQISKLLREARSDVDAYNVVVAATNVVIAAQKTAAERGNLSAAEERLSLLEATKRRHVNSVVQACNSRTNLIKEKNILNDRKVAIRERLDAHTNSVIGPYEKKINYYLDLFNAGFNIVRTAHKYTGGIATSSYELLINNTPVTLGDARTPPSQHSFKNTLSAGDRTTLALAFFLASLEREPDLGQRVVVFDDPFSSQDSFRRTQTVYEILRVARKCNQVIVLSHDLPFLRQLWDKLPSGDRAALQVIQHPTAGSRMGSFDLEQAARGRAAAELDDLVAYRATGSGNPREIIKKLRIVLETYFRATYPNAFLPTDNLGEILRKIREDGVGHPAAGSYEQIERINDYTAQYHHGEDPGGAVEPPIDETELRGFVTQTLRTVNALSA